MAQTILDKFLKLFFSPARLFVVCMLFGSLTLLLDGTLIRLWSLHRDHAMLTEKIQTTKREIARLDKEVGQAKDPSYIEREARERLQLVSERDLLFLFTD